MTKRREQHARALGCTPTKGVRVPRTALDLVQSSTAATLQRTRKRNISLITEVYATYGLTNMSIDSRSVGGAFLSEIPSCCKTCAPEAAVAAKPSKGAICVVKISSCCGLRDLSISHLAVGKIAVRRGLSREWGRTLSLLRWFPRHGERNERTSDEAEGMSGAQFCTSPLLS